MKLLVVYIIFLCLLPCGLKAQKTDSAGVNETIDSLAAVDAEQDAIIDEIVEQKSVPQKHRI